LERGGGGEECGLTGAGETGEAGRPGGRLHGWPRVAVLSAEPGGVTTRGCVTVVRWLSGGVIAPVRETHRGAREGRDGLPSSANPEDSGCVG
jgi:hypothetical protein